MITFAELVLKVVKKIPRVKIDLLTQEGYI